jgi:hypothetical protein
MRLGCVGDGITSDHSKFQHTIKSKANGEDMQLRADFGSCPPCHCFLWVYLPIHRYNDIFCLISYGYLLDFRSQVYHSSSFQELNPLRSFQFLVRIMQPATHYAQVNRGFVAKLLRKVSSVHIQMAFVFATEIKELQESFIFERCNLVSLRMGTW